MKSQGGFLSFVTGKEICEGPSLCTMAEFQSATISRVVKSTMAAESAALSTAVDRQLYLRLLLECLIWGEPNLTVDWRNKLKIPGILVTDARSLYDHLHCTGSIPKERQTLIDLLVARDLLEEKSIALHWVPTTHQLADIFTKAMLPTPVIEEFLRNWTFSLRPTETEEKTEEHRKSLRQGQRARRKERRDDEWQTTAR